ncbi:hypothetical protein Tco_0994474 [Tanacetum coccineum]
MASLKFVDQHNMVACLEKSEENIEFHQIVDFLSTCSINYALTQIHAIVNDRAVVILESSVRNDLLFDDEDGITCLTNDEIFENSALMGYEQLSTKLTFQKDLLEPSNDTYETPCHTKKVFTNMKRKGVKFSGKVTPLFDSMSVPHQAPKGEGSEQPTEPQPTPSPTYHSTGDQPPVQSSHDSPLLGDHTSEKAEGGLNLEELFVLCTNLSNRVLALETSKDDQATKVLKLKDQINKLKRKCKPSILHHRAWLKSVKRLLMKKRLGRKEYVSKQGRKNAKPEPTLDVFDDLDADVSTARLELSTARPDVDAARQEDSVVEPRTPPTTTSIFDDEDITMAQTLIKMKKEKAKEKGVSIKDIKDSSRPARSILTLKPLPIIDLKDKGKSVLEELEPAKKMTRSDFDAAQITRDAEIARQLQVDLQAEVERERQREEEASKAAIAETYDEVQAGIDADALFAAKLQQEEREEYTIEERAKFLAETIVAQRKFRAAQRSAEIRSRPPTKSQLRNLMMTYLKNMGGYKHSQLKAKTFAEIQGLYERQKRVIDDFKPMDSDDAVKDSKEAAGVHKQKVLEEPNSTKVEVKQEGHEESIRKRPGRRLKMKATKKSKRQKTDADLEEEEQLKAFLKIVPDEEGIIDYEVLEKRFPIINWESKFYDFDRHGAECIYYRIFRSDGSSRWIKTFSEMVTRFDRLDLVELYNLVMKRFETTTPEGVDLVLWGDLRIMFDANAEDELWQNQERWNLKSWDLYENFDARRWYCVLYASRKKLLLIYLDSFKSKLMNLESMMGKRRIFKCWFYSHTTNGHQFTMSNRHQELASPRANGSCKELASPKQTALALTIPEQTATGKEISNPFMAGLFGYDFNSGGSGESSKEISVLQDVHSNLENGQCLSLSKSKKQLLFLWDPSCHEAEFAHLAVGGNHKQPLEPQEH